MTTSTETLLQIYKSVIDDVINEVRDLFLENGIEEETLVLLKTTWEGKVLEYMNASNLENAKAPAEDKLLVKLIMQEESVQSSNASSIIYGSQEPVLNQSQSEILMHSSQQIGLTCSKKRTLGGGKLSSEIKLKLGEQKENVSPKQIDGIQDSSDSEKDGSTITDEEESGKEDEEEKGNPEECINLNIDITAEEPSSVTIKLPSAIKSKFGAQKRKVILKQTDWLHDASDSEGGNSSIMVDEECEESINSNQLPNNTSAIKPKLGAQKEKVILKQTDGLQDSSDSEEDSSIIMGDEESNEEEEDSETGGPEPAINSDDDITDEEPSEAFENDNIIVCQYNQIIRRLNKWRFYFKSGIMTLNGREHFFEWAYGEGEW